MMAQASFIAKLIATQQVTDNTPTAVESAMRIADKQGFGLIQDSVEERKIFHFFDSSDGDGDLHVSIADCSTGWSLRPKTQQALQFSQVWSGGSLRASYNLHHVDPTVQSIAFKLTTIQVTVFGCTRCSGTLPRVI